MDTERRKREKEKEIGRHRRETGTHRTRQVDGEAEPE